MHPILDDSAKIGELDTQDVLSSILKLPDQCLDAHQKASQVVIPADYSQVKSLVMCGMGGSGLGARVIDSIYGESLKIPLIRVNDYSLHSWVNETTLVILSSYSGTTEETIQNFHEAKSKNAKMLVIASGGDLIRLAKDTGTPYYQIDPFHNPSNQPRMALGYSIFGQLAMVSKIGLIKYSEADLDSCIKVMRQVITKNQASVASSSNPAKTLALKIENKQLILLTGKPLLGALHIVKNQCNENAKHFCNLFDLPELNHHLMEGLRFPDHNPDSLFVLLVMSDLFSQKIKKRLSLTADIIAQNNLQTETIFAHAPSYLAQTFEMLQFGSFLVYYLVALHHIDPAPIPWVDYFKANL